MVRAWWAEGPIYMHYDYNLLKLRSTMKHLLYIDQFNSATIKELDTIQDTQSI